MRNFLWGDQEDRKKYHLVNWEQVCLHISASGLGVRPIKVNVTFLSKWLWRLGNEGEFPWKTILIPKYRVGNLGWEVNPSPRRASGMWRAIAACGTNLKKASYVRWGVVTGVMDSPEIVSIRVFAKCASWASTIVEFRNIFINDIFRAWKECEDLA